MAKSSRPVLITIIGGLTALLGIVLVVLGLLVVLLDVDVSDLSLEGAVGAGGIIIGLIYLVIGYGFLSGWKIIWYLGVIIYAILAVFGLLAFPSGLIFTLVAILILYYLFRPKVKSFFNI